MKNILGFLSVICLFLAGGEANTPKDQIIWSGSMLAISFICGLIVTKKYMTQEELDGEV